MKLFNLSLIGMVLRFYLMMTVVLIAGFTGTWAIAILALPIFFSGMVGMSFGKTSDASTEAKQVQLPESQIESQNLTDYSKAAA